MVEAAETETQICCCSVCQNKRKREGAFNSGQNKNALSTFITRIRKMHKQCGSLGMNGDFRAVFFGLKLQGISSDRRPLLWSLRNCCWKSLGIWLVSWDASECFAMLALTKCWLWPTVDLWCFYSSFYFCVCVSSCFVYGFGGYFVAVWKGVSQNDWCHRSFPSPPT